MSEAMPFHPGAWTEAEFWALGETVERIELIDGELHVSPSAAKEHTLIASNLRDFLRVGARKIDHIVYLDADVRLGPGRILAPDVFCSHNDRPGVPDLTEVLLVAEVTSPGNAAYDRGKKRQLYAEAGIEWYISVEPDMASFEWVTLELLHLVDGRYTRHAFAGFGETLSSDEPFPIAVPTPELLVFR